jgi:ABC-type multidrug transport system ATPase subunit
MMRGTLELHHVARRYGRPPHQRTVLHDLDLTAESGELVAVWGLRRCGRSTLLRVAAGVEPPDSGHVRYDGQELTANPRLLGSPIGYCPRHPPGRLGSASVLDTLTLPQLARGSTPRQADRRTRQALERTEAGDCARERPYDLEAGQQTRVTLAQALTLQPSLIVIDEPLTGVDLLERDPILELLRTIADDGTTILMSTGEAACLTHADRALTLSQGRLHGHTSPQYAQLIPLHPPRHRAA